MAYAVSAFSYTPGDPGLFGIDATADPGSDAVQQMAMQIVDEVKNWRHRGGITKAKKMSLSHHLAAHDMRARRPISVPTGCLPGIWILAGLSRCRPEGDTG